MERPSLYWASGSTGEFPAQRPVMRSFDFSLIWAWTKRLIRQSRRWCFETPLRSLWHHCNILPYSMDVCLTSWDRTKWPHFTDDIFKALFGTTNILFQIKIHWNIFLRVTPNWQYMLWCPNQQTYARTHKSQLSLFSEKGIHVLWNKTKRLIRRIQVVGARQRTFLHFTEKYRTSYMVLYTSSFGDHNRF